MRTNERLDDVLKTICQNSEKLVLESLAADREDRIAHGNFEFLKQNRFFSLIVPEEFSGEGFNIKEALQVVSALAEYCLSTAICLGMHFQQISVISASNFINRSKILLSISEFQLMVASVTTDVNNNGKLFDQGSEMFSDDESHFTIERFAPIVSYASEAYYFLVTTKIKVDALHRNALVILEKNDIDLDVRPLKLVGMRGTGTSEIFLKASFSSSDFLTDNYNVLVNDYMIATGHLFWSAAWLGSSRRLFRDYIRLERSRCVSRKVKINDDTLLLNGISTMRVNLEAMQCLIDCTVKLFEEGSSQIRFRIAVNAVKLFCSKNSEDISRIISKRLGFHNSFVIKDESFDIDKVSRDLSSAKFMFNNESLHLINGTLSISEIFFDF